MKHCQVRDVLSYPVGHEKDRYSICNYTKGPLWVTDPLNVFTGPKIEVPSHTLATLPELQQSTVHVNFHQITAATNRQLPNKPATS